jgi:hypothetical protein
MLVSDPGFWHRRAEEARRVANRTPDEKVKQTMLGVAEVCDSFAIGANMCSIYEIALSSRPIKHGALLDAELLAEVHVDLIGFAREERDKPDGGR